MNMDIVALYGDFRKLTENVTTINEAIDMLSREFQMDEKEVLDLVSIVQDMIMVRFDLSKLKKKHEPQFESTVSLMIDSFFFGMFIARNENWSWPEKKY